MQLEETSEYPSEESENNIDEKISDLEKMDHKKLVALVIEQEFRGPIPHPSLLKGYEQTLPGAADRILAMAELEQQHRHREEMEQLRSAAQDSKIGLLLAFLITVFVVASGTAIVILVPSVAGKVLGSLLNLVGVTTLAQAFINGKDNKKDDEKEKNDE